MEAQEQFFGLVAKGGFLTAYGIGGAIYGLGNMIEAAPPEPLPPELIALEQSQDHVYSAISMAREANAEEAGELPRLRDGIEDEMESAREVLQDQEGLTPEAEVVEGSAAEVPEHALDLLDRTQNLEFDLSATRAWNILDDRAANELHPIHDNEVWNQAPEAMGIIILVPTTVVFAGYCLVKVMTRKDRIARLQESVKDASRWVVDNVVYKYPVYE
jgi:hypothetical protein